MPKKPTYEELEKRVKELEKVADERRRTSKVFLASDQEKEAILNSLMEHVIHQDTEMRILWANRAACESANLPYEEIVGHYCYEIWPKRSDPCSDCPVIKAMEMGQPQVIEKTTPDGRYWFIRGYPLRDRNGDIVGGIEVTLEITELKQAEEAVRESEHKYSALVQESPDAIISLANTGNLLSFNPAAERISGLSAEEVIGKHFTKIGVLAKQSIPKALKEFALVITGTKRPPSELTIMNKDKSYFFMEANPRLIKHKGEKAWIQVTLRDITDRKLAEEEKKKLEAQLQQAHKMEAIGTLAGGIAHDFNNILGIILGNTELAIDDVPEWDLARFNLQKIRSASLLAKDVVHQLLSFARKTKLEKKPTNIIPIIKESLKLLRSSIPTSIEIRQNITKNVDKILADPTQINQVLINLCTNADHAMPDGGILEISLKNIELDEDTATQYSDLNSGQYVNLTVSDTGHGISQGDIDRIFDPYFTTKEVGKGTGMGLPVVHGIVKSHGGTISVESKLGKGTTFHIYFPVIEAEAVIETETVEELPMGNERILFVDDEESMVYVGRTRLERLGYQVETRMNPVEALELLRSQPDQFDLIITDMTMPKMTGDKLTREILNIRPDIPIILCTGFSEKINGEKAKEIGAAGYLDKPHDKRDLAIRVRQVLDGK
jgi:PAS domain S-box-containing protein